jgi:hypothetical protein
MSNDYRKNHYVPVWYQKRFIMPGARDAELFYLDLRPGVFTDGRGVAHPKRGVRRLGPKHCFYERDLYTANFGAMPSTEIERLFFGAIDSEGRHAVEHFSHFRHDAEGTHESLNPLMLFMSTQKLRTPKGLGWLSDRTKAMNRDEVLKRMVQYRQLFCAIWTESVWLIADASGSATKFILSDHPVTVYNRRCGPRSQWCRGHNDPDIWLAATHTIFPLSLDKVLILTNLSWVRNPYQDPMALRPNPNPLRDAMFSILDIQMQRYLSEPEVREINFLIKSRALRYVAAGREEWLYPERHVSKSDWARYGHGYLLMPDPRSVPFHGEIMIGFKDGTSTAYDEYGRRPGQPGYRQNRDSKGKSIEWNTFHRFQGEFARLFGPFRRGRSFAFDRLDPERDDDDYHKYHLSLEKRKHAGG